MWIFLLVLISLLAYFVHLKKSKYWESRGVPGPKPLPLVGNLGQNIFGKKVTFEIYGDIYKEYADYPFVGIYRMGSPCLLIRDPEIIKNIIVKDFSYFINNDIFVDKHLDPLFGRNPFVLKDEEWKTTRQLLTPGFAPAKIKTYFPLVESVGKNFAKYLEKQEGLAIDLKDACGKFTCDTVALCAFGMEAKSFEDPKAYFLRIMRKMVAPGNTIQNIKLAMSIFMPPVFKIKILPKSFDDDVIKVAKDILKYRQENNVKRNDYFEAMTKLPNASEMETAAHLAGFIIDGYETSSVALTFTLFELAANPDCQEKLREEVNTILEKYSGEFSYEALKDMVYLEACVNETLRLHPPLAQLSKTCNKTYTISSTGDEFKHLSVTLEPGSVVIIPLLGLHKDPQYFPSPEKFMPERFLEKNETNKFVYLPFGNGQRACLGSRFGLLQSKVGIASVIKDLEVTLDPKTHQPLKYDPFYFLLNPKDGAFINCRKITK